MPLHATARSFLEALAQQNKPDWSELLVHESRAVFAGLTELFGRAPKELASVEELTTDCRVPLRVYRPVAEGEQPAVMYFHGGGWVLGDIDTHDVLCRRLALCSQRVVVSVDYRLAPQHRFPSAFDDCYAATSFIARQASDLGIASQRIAVAGDSAGGNLAAAVSLKARDLVRAEQSAPKIEKQVLIYPVIRPRFDTESYRLFATDHGLSRNTMKWFWQQYAGDALAPSEAGGPNLNDYLSLRETDLDGLPHTLVVTAEYDVLRSEGEAFAAAVESAGNRTSLIRYEGMLHGFVHFSGLFEDGIQAIHQVGEFLKQDS